jgi:hypothetical protein
VKLQAPILFGLSQLNLLAGQRYCSEGSAYTDDDDDDDDDSVHNIAGHINSGQFVLSCSASSCKNIPRLSGGDISRTPSAKAKSPTTLKLPVLSDPELSWIQRSYDQRLASYWHYKIYKMSEY